jgi:hypothetical protein
MPIGNGSWLALCFLYFCFRSTFVDLSTCFVHKGHNCVEAFRHLSSSKFCFRCMLTCSTLSCGLCFVCVCKLVFHL